MSRQSDHRLVVWAVAALLVGVVSLWALYTVRYALLVIYVSGLLAIGFSPSVQWLERQPLISKGQRLPRWAAILVLYFGVLGTLAILLAIVIPPLVQQAVALWQELPSLLRKFQQSVGRYGFFARGWTAENLLRVAPTPSGAFTGLLTALQGVIGVIGTLVVILVLPYYFLVEADGLRASVLQLFAPERRPWIDRVTRVVTGKVGAWLNGQLLLSATIGASSSLGLWIFGVPYFYVLGLIAALGEFVPIIGPFVSALPAVLVAWTVSGRAALFIAAWYGIQQFIEGNILVPKIMQRQLGVSAWSVVVALIVGSELLGVAGAILALPTAAIVQVFLQEYLNRGEE